MQPDPILTQAELEFIQAMHRSQASGRDASASLQVSGGSQVSELLTRLMANQQVTIQAQFQNQQLSFPLKLVEDEFHAQHITLGAPTIYEDGPMLRPWRLALKHPVALEDDRGRLTDLWLTELSFNGVLVRMGNGAKAPKHFSLWFNPEGYAPVALRGARERLTGDGQAAYRLTLCNPQETERLRHYILQQHRLSHPELHAG